MAAPRFPPGLRPLGILLLFTTAFASSLSLPNPFAKSAPKLSKTNPFDNVKGPSPPGTILLTRPQMNLAPEGDLESRLKIAEANSKLFPLKPLQDNETVLNPDCDHEACAKPADLAEIEDQAHAQSKRELMNNDGLFSLLQSSSAPSQKLTVRQCSTGISTDTLEDGLYA